MKASSNKTVNLYTGRKIDEDSLYLINFAALSLECRGAMRTRVWYVTMRCGADLKAIGASMGIWLTHTYANSCFPYVISFANMCI